MAELGERLGHRPPRPTNTREISVKVSTDRVSPPIARDCLNSYPTWMEQLPWAGAYPKPLPELSSLPR